MTLGITKLENISIQSKSQMVKDLQKENEILKGKLEILQTKLQKKYEVRDGSIIELAGLAHIYGTKNSSTLNKEELCIELGIEDIPDGRFGSGKGNPNFPTIEPVKVLFTSVENGETVEFPSMSKAATAIKRKDSSAIVYRILRKKVVEYDGKKWLVSRK